MQEYLDMWKGYVDFSGRTTVRGYWIANLVNFFVAIAVGLLSNFLRLPILSNIFSAAIFLPSVAITIRRLRDSGRNPLWILINFVPCVGWVMMIVFLCKPSVD